MISLINRGACLQQVISSSHSHLDPATAKFPNESGNHIYYFRLLLCLTLPYQFRLLIMLPPTMKMDMYLSFLCSTPNLPTLYLISGPTTYRVPVILMVGSTSILLIVMIINANYNVQKKKRLFFGSPSYVLLYKIKFLCLNLLAEIRGG